MLREGDEQPDDDEAQHHAAVVAHEGAGAVLLAVTQVEPQKAPHPAQHCHRQQMRGAAARNPGEQRHQYQRAGGDCARQAIDAVDHVLRVDTADGGKYGKGHGQCPQRDVPHKHQIAQAGQRHTTAVHHQKGQRGLHHQTNPKAELPAVIRQANQEHDHAAHQQRQPRHTLPRVVNEQGHNGHQQRGHDPKATDKGRDVFVLLVLAGVIDQPDAWRQANHDPDAGGRCGARQ